MIKKGIFITSLVFIVYLSYLVLLGEKLAKIPVKDFNNEVAYAARNKEFWINS